MTVFARLAFVQVISLQIRLLLHLYNLSILLGDTTARVSEYFVVGEKIGELTELLERLWPGNTTGRTKLAL